MTDKSLEYYFPLGFRWFGGILIIAAILSGLTGNRILPILLILLGLFLLFTRRGVLLDLSAKRYRSYNGIFGLKWGKWANLPPLERVIITKTLYNQVISSRVSSADMRTSTYRAVLRQGEDFKLEVDIANKFETVLNTARNVAHQAGIPILDCTKRPPTWIE